MQRSFDLRRMTRALRSAPYRWFLLGRVAASASIYMRQVGQGWLIYYLTGSAVSLGWVRTASSLVMLILAPFGGVIADRMERRTILIAGRLVLIVSSIVIAWLVFSGQAQVWHIAFAAMVDSAVFAFMQPAQETIYPELVDEKTLLNAISLDAAVGGLLGMIGAAAAGLLIDAVGAGGVYVGLALLFIFACYTHIRLPKGKKLAQVKTGDGSKAGVMDGLRYMRLRPILITIVAMGFVRMLFAQSANTFMPVYSEVNLKLSASGYGLLTSFLTAGGLLTSLVTAWLGDSRNKGRLFILTGVGAGVALVGMATVSTLPLAYFFVLLLGGALSAARVIQSTILQAHVDPAYRGRVNSIGRALNGISPLWLLPAGILTDHHGAPLVFGIQGAAVLAVYLVMAIVLPKVRRLT